MNSHDGSSAGPKVHVGVKNLDTAQGLTETAATMFAALTGKDRLPEDEMAILADEAVQVSDS